MALNNWYRKLAAGAVLLAAAGSLQAQSPATATPNGYLGTTETPDLLAVVPPAPVAGDPRDTADRAIFRATRSAQGSQRWTLAQRDADYSAAGLLDAFSCALDAAPDARNAPRLSALVARAVADSNAAVSRVKDRYRRKRPFLVDGGPICVVRDEFLASSFDYPSGHSALGWVTGLILAELEPDRAAAILARARAYGESRIFCGVHNASAVEAGRIVGASVVAALHGSPAFREDMRTAGAELAALRRHLKSEKPSCAMEAQAVSESPYAAIPAEAP
jgi:acid phosphatase (class A)